MSNQNMYGNCHNNCNNQYYNQCCNPCCNPCHNPCKDPCHNPCSVSIIENLIKEYKEKDSAADNDFNKALKELYDAIKHFQDGAINSQAADKIRQKIIHWIENCMCFCDEENKCKCKELGEKILHLLAIIDKLTKESFELTLKAAGKLAEARKLDEKLEYLEKEFAYHCLPHTCHGDSYKPSYNDNNELADEEIEGIEEIEDIEENKDM